MKTKISRTACALAIFLALAWAALEAALWSMGPPPLGEAQASSTIVVDRKDRLLRAFTTADGRWRLPVERTQVDERYLRMLLAYEDRRFQSHHGIDPFSIGRAAVQLVANRRIVSGASTLTMQVARLIEGEHERTGFGKIRQMLRALQIERLLDKDEILDVYLKVAPFGGNIEGVRAASLTYFSKEPRRLSIAEAALLVALPQAPEVRRPERHTERARRARDRVLDRMAAKGVILPAEAEMAKSERVPSVRQDFAKLAPHLAESEVKGDAEARIHRLTLDRDIQQAMETLAREQVARLGSRLSTAVLVVDHASGEVLAHVGSADYFDPTRFGGVDMVRALRSPGSALKPFIYGLAFENGAAHPDTLIEDRPVRFGHYAPKNFDEGFHGTVSIREALQHSLNIPAVKVLAQVTPHALVGRFRQVGVPISLPDAGEPSLAIALGGVGFRLSDLTALYAGLARGGEAVRLIHRQEERSALRGVERPKRLLSPVAAWYVADILAGATPPENARKGEIAYKTGTSYGYRDAWAVGFDGRTTIAVWVGRPDSAATPGLTGRTAAAPILFDAFQRLGRKLEPLPPRPAEALSAKTANLPPPLRRFRFGHDETTAGTPTDPPVMIQFPPDRTELEAESMDDDDKPQIVLKAEGGTLPLTWLADGQPIPSAPHARDALFAPDGRGFVKLSVIDAKGRTDRVTVRLK